MSFLQRELQYELRPPRRPSVSFHYSIYWHCYCHDCIPGTTAYCICIVPFMCMCVYSIFDWMRGFYTRFKDKKIVYKKCPEKVMFSVHCNSNVHDVPHTGPHNHMPVNSNPSTWSTQTNSTPYQFGPMPILPPTSSVPCHFSYKTICSQSQFGQIRTKR